MKLEENLKNLGEKFKRVDLSDVIIEKISAGERLAKSNENKEGFIKAGEKFSVFLFFVLIVYGTMKFVESGTFNSIVTFVENLDLFDFRIAIGLLSEVILYYFFYILISTIPLFSFLVFKHESRQ